MSTRKINTVRGNTFTIDKFCRRFGDYNLNGLSVAHILDFLNQRTADRKPQTKRTRFSSPLAFFNFAKNNLNPDFTNPCGSPILRKLFRPKCKANFDTLEKETVDEIIFRTVKPRDPLLLELMARGAMRIGEVLKMVPNDFQADIQGVQPNNRVRRIDTHWEFKHLQC